MESALSKTEREEALDAFLHLEEWDGTLYRQAWDELREHAESDSEAWFAFGRMLQTFISFRDAVHQGRAEIRDGYFVMLEGGAQA